MDQDKQVIKEAMQEILSLRKELKDMKTAEDRRLMAEDIALAKVASGALTYDSIIDERDRLLKSDEDLKLLKAAMDTYGPSVDRRNYSINNGIKGTNKYASQEVEAARQRLSNL